MKRIICLCLIAALIAACVPSGLAASKKAKATATPPPVETVTEPVEPPEEIRQMLDIAYNEWKTLDGKTLPKSNKYTKWRNNYKWEWCAGFTTWCMLEAGIPTSDLNDLKKGEEGPVSGLFYVKESTPGKLLRGFQIVSRAGIMPQKGYLVIYGVRKSANRTTHVGLVYDVVPLGNGRFRITTIEGNMSNRVKMYVHDYDMNAEDNTKNLSEVPKEERDREETKSFSWKLQSKDWYINRFLMPWLPEDDEN
ncbi:MAG: CHAP domain-containing protein [Clostridia bacterium]|nr:CHAP domain-containing protein [Clostridia bacterium]